MTYRSTGRRSLGEALITLLIAWLFMVALDLLGAWIVMAGLHGMHVQTGFWPVWIVLCGVSLVITTSSGSSK